MPDGTAPESAEHESIIVPKEASQLFGAYLRQEFKESLEAIGRPQNQRLVNFIDDLEPSRVVKLVKQGRFMNFEFLKEKGEAAPIADSFILDKHLTRPFLSAIDHDVRNALTLLMIFDEEAYSKMTDVLTLLSKAEELKMSRENGQVKVIPLTQRTTA